MRYGSFAFVFLPIYLSLIFAHKWDGIFLQNLRNNIDFLIFWVYNQNNKIKMGEKW